MRTLITAVLACALSIFATGCVTGTGGQTVQEVQRWNQSLSFWRSTVATLQIQVSTMPEGDRRDQIVAALRTAEWWMSFFEKATATATTQPVPILTPVP